MNDDGYRRANYRMVPFVPPDYHKIAESLTGPGYEKLSPAERFIAAQRLPYANSTSSKSASSSSCIRKRVNSHIRVSQNPSQPSPEHDRQIVARQP